MLLSMGKSMYHIGHSRGAFLMRHLFALAMLFCLAACSNTVASLRYHPTVPVQTTSAASVGEVTAVDQRKEAPTRIATIMGTFGNPLKTLDTASPVKDEVAEAFRDGLRARGLLGPAVNAPFRLQLVVRTFDADMIIGRTARIDLTMSVVDRDGRIVFRDSVTDSQSDMKFLETGMFANIADLQSLLQTVLDRSVDRMLDSSAFRAAVSPGRSS
jgi:ABC-type uncharacterized transport system auxiliary subunit